MSNPGEGKIFTLITLVRVNIYMSNSLARGKICLNNPGQGEHLHISNPDEREHLPETPGRGASTLVKQVRGKIYLNKPG